MVSMEGIILQLEFLICYVRVALLEKIEGKTHARAHVHAHTHTHTPCRKASQSRIRRIPDSSIQRAIAASWIILFPNLPSFIFFCI